VTFHVAIEGVAPVDKATIADPLSTPKLSVSFGVRVDGPLQLETPTVKIGNGGWVKARSVAGRWAADVDVPAIWPRVAVTIKATARPLAGGQQLTDEKTVTLNVADLSPPEFRSATGSFTDNGAGFDLHLSANIFDHTSGIQSLEWSLNGGAVETESFTTLPRVEQTWDKTIYTTLIGENRVRVRLVDHADPDPLASEQEIKVVTADTTPPTPTITSPPDNQAYLMGAGGVTVTVTGTAHDLQSGMVGGQAAVEWALDGQQPYLAATTSDGWQNWQTRVTITELGAHRIHLQFRDRDGNVAIRLLNVQVLSSYRPRSTSELVDRRAYLGALLEFCRDHIDVSAGTPLSAERLTQVFHQPFAVLHDPLFDAGRHPIPVLRIAVEVMRAHLTHASRIIGAYWQADEDRGTSLSDSSGNGNTGTLGGNAGWRTGKIGGALDLGGGSASVVIPDSPSIGMGSLGPDFSVTFWIKPREGPAGSWRRVLQKGADPQRTPSVWLHPEDNRLHFRISMDANWNEGGDSTSQLPLNVWTHVAYVLNGNTLQLFLNGRLDADVALAGKVVPNSAPLHLGSPGGDEAHADLDDIRIYHLALREDTLARLLEPETATQVPVTEADYCLAAYETLLSHLGTSFAELRLARGANPDERRALAERLGVALGPSRPDLLDGLLITPASLDEPWLERTFGLADSHRLLTDPPASPPTLLAAQESRLMSEWFAEDHPAEPSAVFPIIDPDLIGEPDLAHPAAGNAAYDIWLARTGELASRFQALQQIRGTDNTQLEDLDSALGQVLGPGTDLDGLLIRLNSGDDVSAELATLHLDVTALRVLCRIRSLTSDGTLTDAEWTDTCHLLVRVIKEQRSDDWLEEERVRQVALTPDIFAATDRTMSFMPWRGSAARRRAWLDRLSSRRQTLTGLTDGLAEIIRATEAAALPLLRDALVHSLADPAVASQLIEELSELLLVDINEGGTALTTRVVTAATTVQRLIFAKVSGRLPAGHQAESWTIREPGSNPDQQRANFNAEWQWISSYDNWRAAMLVFLYPENLLHPALRDPATWTRAFTDLLTTLRDTSRLTPKEAQTAVDWYTTTLASEVGAAPATQWVQNIQLRAPLSNQEARQQRQLTRDHWDQAKLVWEVFQSVPLLLAINLQRSGQYTAALDWFRTVYDYTLPPGDQKIHHGLELEENTAPALVQDEHWLRQQLNPHTIAAGRPNPYTRFTLISLVDCLLEHADSEFSRDTSESVGTARSLYSLVGDILAVPDLALKPPADPAKVLLPNPRLDLAARHVQVQQTKIAQSRNISGLQRQLDISTEGDILADLPTGMPRQPETSIRPTPYHFSVLMERSKALVNLASQIEAAYFATFEKRDIEEYNLRRAGFDLELSQAGVDLQTRRQTEANDGKDLSRLQRERAELQRDHYQTLINNGLTQDEVDALNETLNAYRWGIAATAVGSLGAIAGTVAAAVGGGAVGSVYGGAGYGTAAGSAGGAVAGALSTGLGAISGAFQGISQAYSIHAQFKNTLASLERRTQDWQLQLSLSAKDVEIGHREERTAQDHIDVVNQEWLIATKQQEQAQASAQFLATKFTNVELYEWMSGVLSGVYRWFLQQANATARLAEAQLAFERQQRPDRIIASDYWTLPPATGEATPDRRGLTGSSRLLQDIYRLDQFAFETDRRKLNIAQTFSLASLAPVEFQQFRKTGMLRFATSARLLDEDFPGHYLRLIRGVRISVIALVPPSRGIRATLLNSGISRVVIGNGLGFQDIALRRDPERVALTSPVNATGVFELDTQSEMLLPFEAMGVDTAWEFHMPRQANPIDYRTIADILVTIEYTALHSDDYRGQVLAQLGTTRSLTTSVSLRNEFPDQWYDLLNPTDPENPSPFTMTLPREMFPPHLDHLEIESLILHLAPTAQAPLPLTVSDLLIPATPARPATRLAPPGDHANLPAGTRPSPLALAADPAATRSVGPASAPDGLISTRRGKWTAALGSTPVGQWSISITDPSTCDLLRGGDVDDLILVIGYRGELPPWL
jgi:hypothetical protein